uniref:Uncharacterized protein n=1 Tax=Romanomermis culicivorax TaxID=13658 RepID=A0A915HYE9_ROMCU
MVNMGRRRRSRVTSAIVGSAFPTFDQRQRSTSAGRRRLAQQIGQRRRRRRRGGGAIAAARRRASSLLTTVGVCQSNDNFLQLYTNLVE